MEKDVLIIGGQHVYLALYFRIGQVFSAAD